MPAKMLWPTGVLHRLLLLFLLVRILECSELRFMRDATARDGMLLLTSGKMQSIGRVMYDSRVLLCPAGSFSTSFVFSISNSSSIDIVRGDGLAFTIAGDLSLPPVSSFGPWLGLFDQTTNRNNHIVGVEFDTVENPELQDNNDNHLGIDVNQIQSWISPTLDSQDVNLHLQPDFSFRVWIEYVNKTIEVFISQNSLQKPETPIIVPQEVDLCKYSAIDGAVYVGFSAATGNSSTDVHRVHSWSFSSVSSNNSGNGTGFEFKSFAGVIIAPDSPGTGEPPGSDSDQPNGQQDRKKKSSTPVILIAVLVPASGALLLFCCCFSVFTYMSKLKPEAGSETLRIRQDLEDNMPSLPSEFSYSELRMATSNFSSSNVLGQGGFGLVYMGRLPSDNSQVAVKRISENSRQGEREFLAEIQIITRLSHRNLVPLRGWCCRSRELLLVYEFMPNGSLDKALFDDDKNTPTLDWEKRHRIISGLASALLYLHEECEQRVVHRDVKPSNVLLDSEYNARLGDFGLARMVNRNRDSRTTNVAGTFGYLAPEINMTGKSTRASDVYSFGIVVLGVATGRKPFDDKVVLVEWISELIVTERLIDAADPALEGRYDPGEMESLIKLGLACSSPNPRARPTMQQVVSMLNGDVVLPELHHHSKRQLLLPTSSSFSISDESFPRLAFESISRA